MNLILTDYPKCLTIKHMEKIVVALSLIFLTACSLFQPKEEIKFKNPIFYLKHHVGGGQAHDEFVTPTSITTVYDTENEKVKLLYPAKQMDSCKLLENDATHIMLRCCRQKYQCYYSRFTAIKYVDEENPEYCHVLNQISYNKPTFEHSDILNIDSINKNLLPDHNCGPTKMWDYRKRRFLD